MRISTSMIFNSGVTGIQNRQSDLYRLQNQLSTGRKILTPEDDPIAASQALVLQQSKDVSSQFLKNQDDAKGKLGLVESQLTALGDLLQNVREKVVQAGNTTLSNADRTYIAQELEARFSEMVGIANAQDGGGNYLFSGYQGATKPYSVETSGAKYNGDEGKRLLQVESSRLIPTNVTGTELFEHIRNGNGTFVTSTNPPTVNSGTGVIDQGTVTNLPAWNAAVAAGYGDIEVRFSVSAGGVTQYELFDVSTATSLSSVPTDYSPGQSIVLQKTTIPALDFGASIVIQGQPAPGDSFLIQPSSNQSIFTTLRNTINTLTGGIGPAAAANSPTEFTNDLARNLNDIDHALENVSKIRATVGSNLKEIDSLANTGEDMQLQYASSLSQLQDLDWAEAISDMASKKLQLEATQLSFKQISQLSLFNIL